MYAQKHQEYAPQLADRTPGAGYEITHREFLRLHQIRARLLRGVRLSEPEQRALGRLMHQTLGPPEPCYGVVARHTIGGLERAP